MFTAQAVETFVLAAQVGDRSERGVLNKPDPLRPAQDGARPVILN